MGMRIFLFLRLSETFSFDFHMNVLGATDGLAHTKDDYSQKNMSLETTPQNS